VNTNFIRYGLLSWLFVAITSVGAQSTTLHDWNDPEKKNCIVVDMDDVWLKANKGKIGLFAGWFMVTNPVFTWSVASNGSFRKKVKAVVSKGDDKEVGFSFKLAQAAKGNKSLEKSYDAILKKWQHERRLVKDVVDVLKRLKDQGYTIIVATNRDRMSYEITAKKLKFDQLYNGKQLFDHVITGGNADFVTFTTNDKGKRFSRLKPDSRLDNYITSAPAFKPSKEYYQVMRDVVDTYVSNNLSKFATAHPRIIFFDDTVANIEGARKAGVDIVAYQVPKEDKAAVMQKDLESALGCTNFWQKSGFASAAPAQ
jgi:FMN phosphatase YigB (HAD superfamily)